MSKKKQKNTGANMSAVFMVVMISVLLMLVGGTISFVPDMKLIYFAYIGGAFVVISGLVLLIRYFIKEEYKLVSNYDFSAGVFLLILGILALLRSNELANSISLIMGFLMLIESIIFLQYTVQLKIVRSASWGVTLIVTLVIAFAALETILDFASLFSKNPNVFYIVLVVVGVIGLIWILIVTNRTHSFVKKEAELSARNLEEDITTATNSSTDSFDEVNYDDTSEEIEDADNTDETDNVYVSDENE